MHVTPTVIAVYTAVAVVVDIVVASAVAGLVFRAGLAALLTILVGTIDLVVAVVILPVLAIGFGTIVGHARFELTLEAAGGVPGHAR